jgi:hypothetical protein
LYTRVGTAGMLEGPLRRNSRNPNSDKR